MNVCTALVPAKRLSAR